MPSSPISYFAPRSLSHVTSRKGGRAARTAADQARFYAHARGSAMEAAAALDTMRVMRLVSSSRYDRGIDLLEGVVAMLTKMT